MDKVRVAVAGAAGRMGKLIVKNVVEDEELELVQAFDLRNLGDDAGIIAGVGEIGVPILPGQEIHLIDKEQVDILVDFTNPEAAIENVKMAASKGIRIVLGTTGFNEEQRKILEEYCSKVPSVIAPNFSIGVNIFFKIVELAARTLEDYDIEIVETHHRFKKDAPSGTALKLADMVAEITGKREIITGRQGQCPRRDEIGVLAIRGGDVVGEHTVLFIGMGERIEITHRAWSRQAFANGAIKAIKFISKVETPGIYTMDDVLGNSRNE